MERKHEKKQKKQMMIPNEMFTITAMYSRAVYLCVVCNIQCTYKKSIN